jgi:hypothetical protein
MLTASTGPLACAEGITAATDASAIYDWRGDRCDQQDIPMLPRVRSATRAAEFI